MTGFTPSAYSRVRLGPADYTPVEYTAACPVCGLDCTWASTLVLVTRTTHDEYGQNQTRARDEVQATENCKCQEVA